MSQQAGQCGYCFGFCKNECEGARRSREMMEGMFPPYGEIDSLRRQLVAAKDNLQRYYESHGKEVKRADDAERECKRLGNANLDAITKAQALEELRRAVDRFFSFRATGNQSHVKVSWEAWDQLKIAHGNLPAWLYAESREVTET